MDQALIDLGDYIDAANPDAVLGVEVAFLFPWAVALGEIGVFGYWSMVIFLLILTIGFVYEWKKGGLEWE